MRLIAILIFTFGVCVGIYLFITYFIFHLKEIKKINWFAFVVSALVGISILTLTAVAIYRGSKAPDSWCTRLQNSTNYPPQNLKTAMDYFEMGNYDYDLGNCSKAVEYYTKSIKLNPNYPQAFNNRGFTYMRMRNYKNALTDLNIAIKLNPNYINALMNRADIHNYYFEIDKNLAIQDYEKVISLSGGSNGCEHLFIAKHDRWSLGTLFSFPIEIFKCQGGL